MSRVLSVLPVCLLIPALAIAQEVAKVTEKTRYAPPPMNQEGCGVEYECVAPNLCNDFGYVSDPESSKHPQVPAFEEGYLGGFSTIPDQSCVVPASGKQGRCCHKLPAEQCPNDDFCIPGWYCPPQDARRYEELHHHPRACLLHDAKYAVCCPKFRPYLRTTIRTNTRTCGVRNSDGIKPRFTIGTTPYQNENQLDERILDPDRGIYSNQSRFGEFPWQALIYSDSSQFLAGGVLITRKHVITAAHMDVGDVADITDTDITDSRRRHHRQSSPTSPTVVADIPDSPRRRVDDVDDGCRRRRRQVSPTPCLGCPSWCEHTSVMSATSSVMSTTSPTSTVNQAE
ncbi:unnamed protein product [Cyprideis torosa]|uniref:Peptidase S1 domain-containing protein n=1 Tax=Cyprideis torosa TaxID=163714 RepID=A0A7R8WEH4_9CRUS|nr:unnamed protein product [Cyprideis torosa]CAG0890720.1 unnamed protein product [Cyprideis torosa]